MTTCPRCGRTFAAAFREKSRGVIELQPGDAPPAHFITKPEPGKPLPHRCWEEKWVRAGMPPAPDGERMDAARKAWRQRTKGTP